MKAIVTLSILLSYFCASLAQASLLPTLLNSAQENLIDTKGGLKKPVPIVNSLELRMGIEEALEEEDDGFSDDKKAFRVRFQPKNTGEYTEYMKLFKTQKKILDHYISATDSEKQKDIYRIYLDYVYYAFLDDFTASNLQVAKDKLRVLKQATRKDYSAIFEYQGKTIQLQKEHSRVIRGLERRKEFLKSIFNLNDSLFAGVKKYQLISIPKVKRIIARLEKTTASTHNEIELKKLELKQERQKFKLEKDEQSTFLRFIEVQIDQDNDDRSVGFNLAFDLPFTRDNSVSFNQRYISAIKAQRELGRLEERWEVFSQAKIVELKNLIDDINFTNDAPEYKNLKNYLRMYRKRKNSSVLRILSLQERINQIEIEKLKNTFEALKLYIEVIFDYHQVAKRKGTNFLDPKLQEGIFDSI